MPLTGSAEGDEIVYSHMKVWGCFMQRYKVATYNKYKEYNDGFMVGSAEKEKQHSPHIEKFMWDTTRKPVTSKV